ncbi:MAG: hypothetical protein ABL888_16565 [Pirellulaceae bacterium]
MNYRTIQESPLRDVDTAKQKHDKALKALEDRNYSHAEQFLHEALIADVTFGPAHNTLGKIYYDQKKLYWAAWEFEYAIGVMPNRAEPLNNLGLALEAAQMWDDAIVRYEQAVALAPEEPTYIGNLARAKVRRGDSLDEIEPIVRNLLLVDSRTSWRKWGEGLLVKQATNPVGYQSTNSDLPFEEMPPITAPTIQEPVEIPDSFSEDELPSINRQ